MEYFKKYILDVTIDWTNLNIDEKFEPFIEVDDKIGHYPYFILFLSTFLWNVGK